MNDISNNETHKPIYKKQKNITIDISTNYTIPPRILAPRSSILQPNYTYHITKYTIDR